MFVSTVFVFVTLNFDQFKLAEGFQSRFHKDFPCNRPIYLHNWIRQTKNDYDEGEVGKGPNWIEKSFPVETGGVSKMGLARRGAVSFSVYFV